MVLGVLLEEILASTSPSSVENFLSRHTFDTALKILQTSAANIWFEKRLKQDIKALVRVLLLKATLQPKAFERYIERCKSTNSEKKLSDESDPEQAASCDAMLSDRKWHTKHREFCFDLAKRLNSHDSAKRTVSGTA